MKIRENGFVSRDFYNRLVPRCHVRRILPSRIDRFFSRDLPTFSRIPHTRVSFLFTSIHVLVVDDTQERDKDKREILTGLTDDPP